MTEINDKVKQLKECKSHVYSEKEVGEMVAKGQKAHKMKGNLALRKIELDDGANPAEKDHQGLLPVVR